MDTVAQPGRAPRGLHSRRESENYLAVWVQLERHRATNSTAPHSNAPPSASKRGACAGRGDRRGVAFMGVKLAVLHDTFVTIP